MSFIDLRSDTVTQPCNGMRQAIAEAKVGDDVFGEDPTVLQLQERVASLFGKEAALFVPSGTMGNEICIKCHTAPGDEVICEANSHFLNYESGAAPLLAGVQMRPVSGERGVLTSDQIAASIRPSQYYFPRTSLISLENTHNHAGGTLLPITNLKAIYQLGQDSGLPIHLDGARIWNAAIASGIQVAEYAKYCDSISVCFSKGLGAPIGSAIIASTAFITKAHRMRKVFGGGMRQAGILAAGALYGLEHNFKRMKFDHKNARALANGLATIGGVSIDLDSVQTNIVMFDITDCRVDLPAALEQLQSKGVKVVPFGPTVLRAVTHLDISEKDIENALEIFASVLA